MSLDYQEFANKEHPEHWVATSDKDFKGKIKTHTKYGFLSTILK